MSGTPVGEAAVFLGATLIIAAVGLRVGMLVARWLDRPETSDEEPGDDDRPDA